MGRIACLGEEVLIQGYALVGVLALATDDAAAVRAAWAALDSDVDAVILTPSAAAALGDAAWHGDRLVVVLP